MAGLIENDNSLRSPLIDRGLSDPSTNVSTGKRVLKANAKDKAIPKFPMFCILLTVLLERVAYYSLLGNLVVYLNSVLDWSPNNTVILTLIFTGITWLSCFIGGILGDAYFGRFGTIIIGLCCYLVGFICLPFITFIANPADKKGHDDDEAIGRKPFVVIWLCFALLLVSLGEGCFKANMSPFGADQLSRSNDSQMQNFFNGFYWVINIGSFLGFGPMIYLQLHKSFIIGYGTSAGLLLLAILVFILPTRKRYFVAPKVKNVVSQIFHVIKEARKNKEKNQNQSRATEYDGSGCFEDFVPIKHWLDRAMTKYGGSHLDIEVEEVKILLKIMPVFGFLIIYCILYFQTTGTFILQGIHMKLKLDTIIKSIPAAWLALFNNVTILIFVPFFDRLMYPGLAKLGIKVPYVVRMMIGMVLASLAMVSAGLVEVKRQNTKNTTNNTINRKTVIAADLTIFYQVPQFMLIGISEIFVLITGLEYAYCKAPRKMQAIVTGLFFIANGIGSMLGSVIIELGNLTAYKFFGTKDTDQDGKVILNLTGNLQYLFFGLAVLNFVNLLFFAWFCWKRRDKEKKEKVYESVDEYIRSTMSKSKNSRARSDEI